MKLKNSMLTLAACMIVTTANAAQFCSTAPSVPQRIPNPPGSGGPGTADNTLGTITVDCGIPGGVVAGSVNVVTVGTHTWSGDLVITLTNPSGTPFLVRNSTGGSADWFGDNVNTNVWNNQLAAGVWNWSIDDDFAGDIGTITSFCVTFTCAVPPLRIEDIVPLLDAIELKLDGLPDTSAAIEALELKLDLLIGPSSAPLTGKGQDSIRSRR